MSDDFGGLSIKSAQRTSENVSGRGPNIEEPLEQARLLVLRRAAEVVALGLVYPLLIGPPILVVYVPLLVRILTRITGRWLDADGWDDEHPWQLVAVGLGVLLTLAAVPDAALAWWPFGWQAHRATLWGVLWPLRWPRLIPFVVLLRMLPVIVASYAWHETWFLDQRQRQEIIAPTASGVAFDAHPAHSVSVPGIYNPYRAPGGEPEPQGPRSYGDIIIDGVEIGPPPARVLASNPVSGEPSVAVGGNGGGRHTTQARIPTSLLGGDRQHVRDLLRVLHDAYGALADGETLSRANLRRHGLSNNQARDLSAWFREQGYAALDAANQHELTQAGADYLGVALVGIEEARRRIE